MQPAITKAMTKSWWWFGFVLMVANSVIAGMCLYASPVVWIGLCNLAGAGYIASLLFQLAATRDEKLAALLRYRDELAKQPASQEVYATLAAVDHLAESLRRRKE